MYLNEQVERYMQGKEKTNLDFKTRSTTRKKHRCWKRFMELETVKDMRNIAK